MKSDGGFQTDVPQSTEKGTQSIFNELTTEKDVQSKSEPFIFKGNQQKNVNVIKKRYFCEFCEPPKEFSSSWSRKRHITNKHNSKKILQRDAIKLNNSKKRRHGEDFEESQNKKLKVGFDIAGKRKRTSDNGGPKKFTRWS